jgi:hypothetical protein
MKRQTMGNSTGGAQLLNSLPEDSKNFSVTANIAFGAYCETVEEIKELREVIHSMTLS